MLRSALVLLCAASLAVGFPAAAAAAPIAADNEAEKAAIIALIRSMEAAWNRGDFRGYMAGFKNPDVVFVSNGKIQTDWQATLDHYIRDYGASPETRGRLSFRDISIEMLAPDAAQLISRYRLDRPVRTMEGVNTRLMRKIDGRWVIALNHVSAYEVAPAQPVK